MRQVWPEVSYSDRDWYLLLSRFQALTEQFLAQGVLQAHKHKQLHLLLKALQTHRQFALLEKKIQAGRRQLAKAPSSGAATLYQTYELEQQYYDYVASPQRRQMTNLQQVSDSLDHFFIAEKLKQACLAYSRQVANQEDYELHLLEVVWTSVLQRPHLRQIPAIGVYAACYQAVVLGGSEADFEQLREVMNKVADSFPRREIRDIYLLAINYCIRAQNLGQQTFTAEALLLYEQCLDRGYLLEDGQLSESTFLNIVTLALKLNRYDWTDHFIDTYAKYLPPALRASVLALSKARASYGRQLLVQAMQQLAQVEAKAPFLYLAGKSLQIKIFYEMDMWDALDSLLESLRVYLQRNTELGYRRAHYQQMLQFSRRLIQLKPDDRLAREQLAAEIREASVFAEKAWFLAQL